MNNQQKDNKNPKIKSSDHSLAPDIYTGWQSKTLISKLRQFPLVFAHQTTDLISKTLTSFGSQYSFKVVYMGFRPGSNMKAFKEYGQSHHHKYVQESFLYGKKSLKRFKFLHSEEPEKYFPIRPSEYRLFKGINPTWKHQDIKFSSDFQCGNLDLAIFVNPNEYDLLMRVDSNTRGHTCWYFFKVFDIKKKKKIRFNIINFTKGQLLYASGMKPYVFRTSTNQWTQQGIDVQFKNKAIRYFSNDNKEQPPTLSKCLSFTYDFTNTEEQVYFAYSIPYSYSNLLDVLQELEGKHSQFLKVNLQNESTGGLPLPVLTITNPTIPSNKKKNHLVIGRLHPGQTQGSWMIEGFIRFLLSPDAHYLRDRVQFKIIPMVNADGVVLGNFRTGIGGKDLNRMFNKPDHFNQTKLVKLLAQSSNPEVFLDFHGHSGKKNVFTYGPEYKIQDSDYITSRILPKLISRKTQAFRYYACIFKISECKINTGRALMFFQYKTRFVFTIQASTYGYGHGKDCTTFTFEKYLSVGHKIAQSLQQFSKILLKVPKRLESSYFKQYDGSRFKNSLLKHDKLSKRKNNQNLNSEQALMKEIYGNIDDYFSGSEFELQKELFRQILSGEKQLEKTQIQTQNQSDSDCQDTSQDYTDAELKKIEKSLCNNKTDSIQKILVKNSKSKSPSKSKRSKLKNFNTLDGSSSNQTNLINRSLILKRDGPSVKPEKQKNNFSFMKQFSQNQELVRSLKFNESGQIDNCMDSKQKQIGVQKLRKIDAWRIKNFKKGTTSSIQIESMSLQRNKSANQVYLQGPPTMQQHPLHKLLPKMKSESKKKEHVLLIKKSFLPQLHPQLSNSKNNSRSYLLQTLNDPQLDRATQKSLINQILELHEKKKRKNLGFIPNNQRKMKIAFYD